MATTINGTILVAGLTATGSKAHRIDGTYLIAGLSSVDGKTPVFLTLNNDGTLPGGGGGGSGTVTSVAVTGSGLISASGSPITTSGTITLSMTASDSAHFARGDGTWSNALVGNLIVGSASLGAVFSQQLTLGALGVTSGIVIGENATNYVAFGWDNTTGQVNLTQRQGGSTVLPAMQLLQNNGAICTGIGTSAVVLQILTVSGPSIAGGASTLVLVPAAHTAVTTNVHEGVSVAAHNITISGNVATMQSNYIGAPTLLGASATQTVANFYNVYIEAPVVSTNAAITNPSALGLGGNLIIPVAAPATASYGLVSLGAGPFDGVTSGFFAGNSLGTHLAFNAASGFGGRTIDSRIAGVRQFAVGLGSVASATSAVLNGIDLAPFTYTISGSTAITTATGFNAVAIGVPTYTAASAVAITIGATLAIAGAPTVAGSATLTTPLSLWIQAGTSRFDGLLTLSSDVTVQRLGAHSIQFGAANNASPVSYTLTGGESARGGTDTNTAGGSLTIASGLGTGTGAVTSIVFQTPNVAASGTTAQALATRLTISSAAITFSSALITCGNTQLSLAATGTLTWNGGGVTLARNGADSSLRLGAANSATPATNILTIGESSRSGTDSNVAGASGTLQSGLGTGTGALASLSLASPIAAASGTTAQTYATGLKILVGTAVLTNYIVANLPAAATAGAGATAFVTDGSTTVILGLGQTVTGGGANKVPVYSDGTNWIIG